MRILRRVVGPRSPALLAAFTGVSGFTLLMGRNLSAFSGFPKGVDAQQHIVLTRFIRSFWPHIDLMPFWYAGSAIYQQLLSPVPHAIFALLGGAFGLSVHASLVAGAAVLVTLIVLGAFAATLGVTKRTGAAVSAALVAAGSTALWGTVVAGGSYTRLVALVGLPLGTLFALQIVGSRILSFEPSRFHQVGLVITVAFTVAAHIEVGMIVGGATSLILLTGLRSFNERISWLLRILVPAAGLSAFVWLPYLTTQRSGPETHLPGPLPLSSLVHVGVPNWDSVNPLILPALAIVLLWRGLSGRIPARETWHVEFALAAPLLALSLLAFAPIPDGWLPFSPYDLPVYISLFGSILLGVLLGNTSNLPSGDQAKGPLTSARLLTLFALAALLFAVFASYPVDRESVFDDSTPGPQYASGITTRLVHDSDVSSQFRIGTDWDGPAKFIAARYPWAFQTNGYYFKQGDSLARLPNGGWLDDFVQAVWRRQPSPGAVHAWLDWFASNRVIVGFPKYKAQLFLDDAKHFRRLRSVRPPGFQTMYTFDHQPVSPILSANRISLLLVLSNVDQYRSTFGMIMRMGLDSRRVIPVWAGRSLSSFAPRELRRFDGMAIFQRGIDSATVNQARRFFGRDRPMLIRSSPDEISLHALLASLKASSTAGLHRVHWSAPSRVRVSGQLDGSAILFKSFFDSSWKAEAFRRQGKETLRVYRAGPNFMLALVPLRRTDAVVFSFRLGGVGLASRGISLATLGGLIALSFIRKMRH